MLLLIFLLFYADVVAYNYYRDNWPTAKPVALNSTLLIRNLTSDVIKDTDQRIAVMDQFKLGVIRSPEYETGFIMYLIHEDYRKMLDIYNTTLVSIRKFYVTEVLMFLQEVETHYWTIDHLSNMLHEVERKWLVIRDQLAVPYRPPVERPHRGGKGLPTVYIPPAIIRRTTEKMVWERETSGEKKERKQKKQRKPRKTKEEKRYEDMLHRLTGTKRRNTRWWWPLEYGWEIDYYW